MRTEIRKDTAAPDCWALYVDGMPRIVGETFQVCNNIEAALLGQGGVNTEAAEVAESIVTHPAPRRLTWDEMPTACPAFADGRTVQLRDGFAHIVSNGSHWRGESVSSLLSLFQVLKRNKALDWTHLQADPIWVPYNRSTVSNTQPPEGAAHATGNFEDVSHGFSVYTDSPRLIRALSTKIDANHAAQKGA